MTPEMVVEELTRNGYQKVAQPLHVADLDFDFAGALTGPNEQESLTLVVEGEGAALIAAQRRLRAFAVVLERTGSTRPITVVVVGDNPNSRALTALAELARVVVVRSSTPLTDSLHSLLPLRLPEPITASSSAETALEQELSGRSDPVIVRLLKAAKENADRVRTAMHVIIKEAIEEQP